jgi:hypothetical protein
MKAEVIAIRKDIPAGETGIFTEMIKDDGRIQEVRARFYSGQERALKVRPYISHKAQRIEDLFTYVEGSENYLSGDDDTFVFPASVKVEYDDELKVWYENSSAYTYTLVLDIVIVYDMMEV